jgi:SAM-dependent methyltransferase
VGPPASTRSGSAPDGPALISDLHRVEEEFDWSITRSCEHRDGLWVPVGAAPNPVFTDEDSEILALAEEQGTYYRVRTEAVVDWVLRSAVQGALWDVGGGGGAVAAGLQSAGVSTVVVEPSEPAAARAAARGLPAVASELEGLQLPDRSLSALGLFDVLEHLASPERTLREVLRVLAPGGRLFVTVPAHPFLWSDIDVHAGHHWRSTRPQLQRLLSSVGLEVERMEHWAALAVPPAAILRAFPYRVGRRSSRAEAVEKVTAQLGTESAALDRVARVLLGMERRWRRHLPLPVGISLMAVGRRRDQST